MIKYVAFMRMRDDTPPEALNGIERQLKLLGKVVAEVRKWQVGRCLGSEGADPPWTFAIVGDFRDMDAYQKYRVHPEHEALRQSIRPYRESSVGMTYEAHYPMPGLLRFEDGIPVPHPRYRLPPLDI